MNSRGRAPSEGGSVFWLAESELLMTQGGVFPPCEGSSFSLLGWAGTYPDGMFSQSLVQREGDVAGGTWKWSPAGEVTGLAPPPWSQPMTCMDQTSQNLEMKPRGNQNVGAGQREKRHVWESETHEGILTFPSWSHMIFRLLHLPLTFLTCKVGISMPSSQLLGRGNGHNSQMQCMRLWLDPGLKKIREI